MIGHTPSTFLDASIDALARFLRDRTAVVLSGAGCSTESGIPDYRDAAGRPRARMPMTFQEFVRSPEARARYWTRSALGWPRFSEALPNDAHRALAKLEAKGWIRGVITQNVDGLHQAAGSRRVLELHGALSKVRCLACRAIRPRGSIQARLRGLNPALRAPAAVRAAPDGDAEAPDHTVRSFRVPACVACGGVLKPDVVFFGENVPRERLERAWSLFEEASGLLVVGSSLTVFSGRRFVLRAEATGRPVAIVNLGDTRADDLARLKVEGAAGEVLPRVVEALAQRDGAPPEGGAAGGPSNARTRYPESCRITQDEIPADFRASRTASR